MQLNVKGTKGPTEGIGRKGDSGKRCNKIFFIASSAGCFQLILTRLIVSFCISKIGKSVTFRASPKAIN
ncbi:uncharacterized protein Dvar_56660 [Desulfosarcina variabilis str. Montpellier]